MNVSVILGHPHPDSFNHAIAQTTVATLENLGHTVYYHDLYLEGFDPILLHEEIPKDVPLESAIQTHCDEIAKADGYCDCTSQLVGTAAGHFERLDRSGDPAGRGI